ncbi:MAG: hypothetical protein JXA78_10585 [Anaerolineales bacterium]|nr:hypothetical protein [Anaerolineales bacterium]
MFISRTGEVADLITWFLQSSLWCAGGWLLCVHAFPLRSSERLFSGIGTGLMLFILVSNLAAHVLPLQIAFWVAAGLVFLLGMFVAWRSPLRPRFPVTDLQVWPQILAFTALFALFILINFGLSISDDYSNLPIVSMIATGDIPLHFYLNPNLDLDYHYGLNLFAASLVRSGGLFPWSAFDISKALAIALAVNLTWLWFRRYIRHNLAWLWVGLFILFASGARWLLLFLPVSALQEMGTHLLLQGSTLATGPDLYTALISPWNIEGDGPFPFPFAFLSGLSRPTTLAFGSNGAVPVLALALLLLLARRQWRPLPGLIYGLIISSLALISEHRFLMIWGGIFLTVILYAWLHRPGRSILQWTWPLLPSLILVPIMGGVLGETFTRSLAQLTGSQGIQGVALPGIALRWPPALYSGHLGALSLTNPYHLLIALAEMGPVLFIAPLTTWQTSKYIRSGKLVLAGLNIMATLAFLLPLFIRFPERERDISRMTGTALAIWMTLGLPYIWRIFKRSNRFLKALIATGYVITIFSGIALLPSQLIAIAQPQASYFIEAPDAMMSRAYWNQLESEAWILDIAYPYRPVALFGRTTGPAYESLYIPLAEFSALREEFNPVQLARSGYSYIYIDRKTWQRLSADQRQAFQQPCAQLLAEQKTALGDFRRLYKIKACQNTAPNP